MQSLLVLVLNHHYLVSDYLVIVLDGECEIQWSVVGEYVHSYLRVNETVQITSFCVRRALFEVVEVKSIGVLLITFVLLKILIFYLFEGHTCWLWSLSRFDLELNRKTEVLWLTSLARNKLNIEKSLLSALNVLEYKLIGSIFDS